MSIGTIFLILSAIGGLIAGMFGGKVIGKVQGKKEGRVEAAVEAQAAQANNQVEAVNERIEADKNAGAAGDDDLDAKLRTHNRAD